MNNLIQTFAVYALPVLFAITLHEAAHAYAAKYFGDTTAYSQGRMSLNPLRHIDPVGTLLIPIVLFFVGSPFLFGYAKPVPVEFGKLNRPKRDMAWVALAGPAANLVMALGWMIMAVFLSSTLAAQDFFMQMAVAGVKTNLVIFAFNLIPVPPLDGGRVMFSILPHRLAWQYGKLEKYGFFIVLGLMFLKVLQFWMIPVMALGGNLIEFIVKPLMLLMR
ncbi:MAG: site-2 protease family protein [Janthinobacterium lividum]